MAANGQLPMSMLAPIAGSSPNPGGRPLLRKDCAVLWNAMTVHAPISFYISEGSLRRAYRPLASQVAARRYWCSLGKCGNAAVPGTSRHGLAINIDLMNGYQRSYVDQHGAYYGWSKRWSDAPFEWWHVTCIPAYAKWHPALANPTLQYGSRGPQVARMQRLLRAHGFKSVKVDGVFGRQTKTIVFYFQRRHHIRPATGICGSRTWKALLNR